MKLIANLFFISLLITVDLSAQTFPDSTKRKIDNLFKKWDNGNFPGGVVGIIRNDSIIYSQGYGFANVEDSVGNKSQSIYYMCSLAKQFTGYAIVLLARQGKLKLDNDIHIYLPWMADFGKKITIQNLLNHTSGIRDESEMAQISGLPIDGVLTQDYALSILKKQQTLNFAPGSKYVYSNSNYILLAEIVKTVSGQSFPSFIEDKIFKPLGMTHSHIIDNSNDIIKGRAVSYSFEKAGYFKNNPQNSYVLGAGDFFSNVDDMAKWVINFYSPVAGDMNDITQLTTKR